MKTSPNPHYRHRFPAEIISHAVWLYHVFSLSLRDVELILAQQGVFVSYETVRRRCQKFGESFAQGLHRPASFVTRAASFRYGGRHYSGIPGAIIPLYPGGIVRIPEGSNGSRGGNACVQARYRDPFEAGLNEAAAALAPIYGR